MDSWDADVVVVGLGIWGACSLWQLAARGVDAVGIDMYQPGHGFGSSTPGGSRMFRLTSLEHPDLAPLAQRSLTLWRLLETRSHRALLDQRGGLLLGPRGGVVVSGTLAAADRHGIALHQFTAAEALLRWPQQLALGDSDVALWEPSAGLINAGVAISAALATARRHGARLVTGTRVEAVETTGSGVRVQTAAREFRARQVVVAAGAWSGRFVPGAPLTAMRFPVTWFRPAGDGDDFALDRLPVFMRELATGDVLWGNGYSDLKTREVKLGLETIGPAAAPVPFDLDAEHREVVQSDWDTVAAAVPFALPGLVPAPVRAAASLVSTTPDGQFLVGRPHGDPRVVVAAGCNAHGFKYATGVGEAVADLVVGADHRTPLRFADPDRFS